MNDWNRLGEKQWSPHNPGSEQSEGAKSVQVLQRRTWQLQDFTAKSSWYPNDFFKTVCYAVDELFFIFGIKKVHLEPN